MNQGKTVFAQLLQFVPFSHFEHLVDVYQANKGVTAFSAWSHFICLAYAQLTRRSGLRDLVACLNAQRTKLYHIGLRSTVSRSTLADAAERRDYRLFEALGQRLIVAALALYGDEDVGLGHRVPVFAMDSTTIDLCLSLFPWAHFRQTKAAVKAHVIMDLRGAIPVFISITTGKVHDVRLLNAISLFSKKHFEYLVVDKLKHIYNFEFSPSILTYVSIILHCLLPISGHFQYLWPQRYSKIV